MRRGRARDGAGVRRAGQVLDDERRLEVPEDHRGRGREWAAAPAPPTKQTFEVLPGRREQRLTGDPPQPPQPEAPQPVPVLGLPEQRLDPHLPLAQRPLIESGAPVGAHPVEVGLVVVNANIA